MKRICTGPMEFTAYRPWSEERRIAARVRAKKQAEGRALSFEEMILMEIEALEASLADNPTARKIKSLLMLLDEYKPPATNRADAGNA